MTSTGRIGSIKVIQVKGVLCFYLVKHCLKQAEAKQLELVMSL